MFVSSRDPVDVAAELELYPEVLQSFVEDLRAESGTVRGHGSHIGVARRS